MADAVHLSPSAYEDAFINTTNPKQTHALLQGRLSAAAKLNDQLADMYKERAQIEASYVSALQKLQSKRGGGGGVARDTLGAFSSVWEAIWGEVQEAVQVHSSLERKMKDEVETPLRSMAVKGDWGKQGAYDGNIERTIKHLDSCQTRLAKAQKKASSSSKDKVIAEVNAASEELNDAQQGWLIESPQVFGLYQAIDTNRLTALKEIFTKWETTRSDIARGEMEASERIMMMVLGWDTLEDLQDFLVKKGSAGGVGASERTPGSRMVSGASNVSRNTTASVVRRPSVSATPPRPRASQNNSSNDFSPAPAQGTPSGGTSNGLSSLNPLKSVFGRNRARASSNASSNRSGNGPRPGPGHTDSFTSSGGGGAGFGMLGDDDDEPTTRRDVASREGTEVLTPVRESNGQSSNQPAVDAEGYSVPPPDHDKKPWETTDLMDDDTDMHTTPLGEPGVGQSSLKMAIAPEPIHESEEEQRLALEKMKSTLAAPGAGPQRRGTVARGRRDVRNTMMINDIPDDQPLGLFVGGRSGGSLSASRGTSRAGSMQQVDSPTAITPTSGLPPLPLIPATNRASSMLSSISSHQRTVGNASAGGASVTGSQQGFRSSITETCNVVSRAGTIVRAMVTGQVEATFRDVGQAELARNGKTIKLRIERFEQLEKVAPNPQFVKALADGQPGEYAVDAEALAGAAAANPDRPVVLFKYQLHIQEGKADRLVPLTVTPQWKCDPTDTKLLIAYGASAESHILAGAGAERSPFGEPSSAAQIDEISFTVPISSANVSNPQSKPFPGEYDPVAKRIVYRAEPLTAETPIGKVAARLAVDEPTVPQPIAVRWIVRGVLCSNLDLSVLPSSAEDGQEGAFDEFGAEVAAGGGAWRLEGVARNCQSGKFLVD